MKKEEIYSKNINHLKRPEQVEKLVSYILLSNKKQAGEMIMSTNSIIEKYNEIRKSDNKVIDIPENTIVVTLSNIANNCSIRCAGKKQGYYFDDGNTKPSKLTNLKDIKEKDLYGLLKIWLSYRCDRVKDISQCKKCGKWGNPDVMGISIYNFNQIEIVTIEAKKGLNNWRQEIFEAIAHLRFSNKVYFAFYYPETEDDCIPEEEELLSYAQQYHIGLLRIKSIEKDYQSLLSPIQILLPAPYSRPEIKSQQTFLAKNDINSQNDIMKWGKSNDSLIK